MKILFLLAWNPAEISYRGRFSKLLSYPSLTLPTLVSLVPDSLHAEIDTCDEMYQKPDFGEHYDIVAISFETSSAPHAYELAARYREQGAYILFGGYHTTNLPQEAVAHADTIIIGAAEVSLPLFLSHYIEGNPQKVYDNQKVCFDNTPIPKRGAVRNKKSFNATAIIADRGCNNGCKYCAISKMWRSNPRPVHEVIAEIKALKKRNFVFFDPNFFAPKQYAVELMTELAKLNIRWVGNATGSVAFDDELLALAQKSGCKGVVVGMESTSSESLRGVGKRFWHADRYKEVVDRFHAYHITVNGCFVLGFDGDTEEELLRMPERIREIGLDLARFAILTPLPGSPIFRDFEASGRIITTDWAKYNQHYAVYEPAHLSPARLEEIFHRVHKETYRFKNVFGRVWRSPSRSPLVSLVLLSANLGFKFLNL